ncbi:hypothetical protein BGW39_003570 [Mortierella sp. 14UC]|nr:hypothetical protein BGW39_003570 [Mortierella sp. 14UC]
MMTGYIEAIEARLHRMEGLLGGLVKDKDPRAEIVRAELDAMAREAEMTGLKLRRSKAYEEIHNAMAASASSTSASASSNGTAVKIGAGSGSGVGSSSSSAPEISAISRHQPPPLQQLQKHQQQQQYQPPQQHQLEQQHQHLQHARIEQEEQRLHSSALSNQHLSNGRPSTSAQQQGSGYRPHVHTPAHSETSSPSQSSSSSRTQQMLQPSPVSGVSRSNQYHPYDNSRHGQQPQTHNRPPHTLQHNQSLSSLSSSHNNTGNTYSKQQHPTHHQQQQQQSLQQHSQYNSPSSYSPASFQLSSHQSNYGNSQTLHRGGSSSYRPSPHSSSHERGHSAYERGHRRTGSSHSNGSSSIGFGTNHHAPPPPLSSNRNGHYGMETHRIVTHRPSLTAHQLSNPLTGYMPILENPIKEESLIMPSVDVIDHLLDIHFRSVHPVLPFLHFKTISDQVHHNESPPPHLLFAVLGLASRFSDNPTFRVPQAGLERPPCTIFYERAKHFIKDEYDNSQMATVQAFLLMAVQQMGFCESQRAWLYVGMAVRMAQGMGLNREPSEQEQSRNRLQCELRKRTWWSIYVIERFICAGLGRDCEAAFPQYEDDESSDTSTNRPPASARIGQIANFVRLITLSKIQGNILEYIRAKFNPSSAPKNNLVSFSQSPNVGSEQDRDFPIDTTVAAFTALDKALTAWRQGLPESLQNPTAQSPHYGLFLHLNYNTLIILLHRPEILTSPTSASLCTQAAATITDIIEILMDAKALTSMFISCIYAIFSAGIVHFMNIPSVKKGAAASAVTSPVLSEGARKTQESHTKSAKTNLKRCIDALKFLATHWVSAASRAKVLEDLLDLKHVSLKDLEVDTFKSSPVGPSWALDSSQYKEALVAPRKTQDKLRQQCRSKAMTIHSLLANDEDFLKMQQRRSTSFGDEDQNDDEDNESSNGGQGEDENDGEEDVRMKQEDTQEDTFMEPHKSSLTNNSESPASLSPVYSRPPIIGLGVQSSPHSSAVSVASPVSVRTDTTSASQPPMGSDPGMVLSTAKMGLSDSPAVSNNKPESLLIPATGLVRHENGILTPMTMTTLAQSGITSPIGGGSRSEGHSPLPNGKPIVSNNNASNGSKQGAMLDPFSMPSSISFPDWNNNTTRRPSHGGNSSNNINTTVWTTDSVTHRTTAHSATSSPMIASSSVLPSSSTPAARGDSNARKTTTNSTPTFQPISSTLYSDSTPSSTLLLPGTAIAATGGEHEEHDLVWNDMPPTLGLDEWTAYIGAMMMRWLYASGHSSPRSTTS